VSRGVRVAYYSPLPPERSGIADYSALLLPALGRRVELVLPRRGRTRPPRGTDAAVYHVGNDPAAHGWIVESLRRRPGVVVLHEFVLHHLVAGLTVGRRDAAGYLDAMEREAGVVGRMLAHGVLDNRLPPLWETRPEDFPLAGEILDLAREHGLVVHSRYVEERARRAGFDGRIWKIPHPAWTPPDVAPAAVTGDPLIGCLGHLNASKRIPQLLEAFARVRARRPQARLLLVGATAARFDLDGWLRRFGLAGDPALVREPYVDERQLWSLLRSCDACVSLRAPTMGETSGIAIRALSLGRPLVVSDIGWFAELPDDVAVKVPVGEREVDALTDALELVAGDDALGERARAYARRAHDVERVAEAYAAAMEEAAGGAAVRAAVLADVARAAGDVGLDADAPETTELGRRLREVGIRE
jgi:glycosyltransferase involved in cell wall biosynthesis